MQRETEPYLSIKVQQPMYKDSIFLQHKTFSLPMLASRFIVIALAITTSTVLHAQQLQYYTQYRELSGILNPAAISSNYMIFEQNGSVGVSYRVQWADLVEAPRTFVLHGDYLVNTGGINPLFGGHVLNDQTGPIATTGIYAKVGGVISSDPEHHGISLALTAGLVQFRVNSDKIRLRDKDDIVAQQNLTSMYPDVGIGFFAYQRLGGSRKVQGDYIYGGVSVPQVIGSTVSVVDDNSSEFSVKRNQHIYGNIGFIHNLWNDSFLEPTVWVKYVPNTPINIDANLRYFFAEGLWAGAGGSSARTAHVEFGFMIGDNYGYENNLKVGYGYDYSFSSFGPSVGGSHELNVAYVFGR